MNFLDSTGLEYFYGKLKEKFIRSVNSYTPDANGNVTITNVATADNLASPDGQTIYDTFIYRTSGGRASISNGEAQLIYIDGNVDIVGRIQESLTIDVENNIQATYNITTWRNQIDETGTYNFTYTRPSSAQATSSWNPGIGTWRYNDSIISLSAFGIECSNIIAPNIVISTTGANIRNLQVVPNTWMSAFETDGTYVFTYDGESWTSEEEFTSLVSLGITMSGTAEEGDKIIVNYQSGTPNSVLTVSYIAPEQGTILVSKPTAFESTGFNQFDKNSMYIQNASIVNGVIASNSGTYIAYCHAKGGVDNGYVAYSANAYIRNIGWCANLPTIGESVVTTGGTSSGTLASIPFDQDGYVVVVVTNISDLCIHPKWSGTEDTKYEDYVAPDVITLPTTSIDSQVLPLNSYGMPSVGNIADRLNLDAGIYVQNIGRYEYSASNLEIVQALGVDYDYDATNIFYVLNDPIIYSVDVDSVYNVNDFGTEEFLNTPVAVKAYMLYGQNLRDKLRTGVVEKTGDTMSGALTISIPNDEANVNFNRKNCTVTIDSVDKIVPIEAGIVPKSNTTIGNFRFIDSKETPTVMGYLNYVIRKNGNCTSTLNCRGYNASGTKVVDNSLQLISKPDGTAEVVVSYPEAWRNGLDVVCKSGDTMTDSLTIDRSSVTDGNPRLKLRGNRIAKAGADNAGSTNRPFGGIAIYDGSTNSTGTGAASDGSFNVFYNECTLHSNNNSVYASYIVRRPLADGTVVNNGFYIGLNTDGSNYVSFAGDGKKAWQKALGIGEPFSMSKGQTATITLETNSSNIGVIFMKRGGNFVAYLFTYWDSSISILAGSAIANVTLAKSQNAKTLTISHQNTSTGAIAGFVLGGTISVS